MTIFETILCCISIPVAFILAYVAGKHDLLGLIGDMIEDAAKELETRAAYRKSPYKVITLCGSTRFKDAFIREQKRLTLEGNVVISVGLFGHSGDDEAWANDGKVKDMLDVMHRQKIDMSDGIFVINEGGYIGDSTKREIEYALLRNKTVEFMCPLNMVKE